MKIQLTAAEQAELRSRAIHHYGEAPTIANYWQQLFASRSIKTSARIESGSGSRQGGVFDAQQNTAHIILRTEKFGLCTSPCFVTICAILAC